VLLVYRIDRISRSIVGLMAIVEELDAAGVALRSATEPIDTHGPVGRMLLQLLGIFAEFERSLLIDRINKGFERKAARGEWLAGPGPFGYRLDAPTKTLVAEPDEAAVVNAIFTAYADERLGATALASRLNDAGQRNRGGRLWSNQSVLRVIRNPVYIAKITHGTETYDAKHEPIVDEALFARARALLDERSAESAAVAPTTSEYLLSGLVRCQVCHGAYVGAGAHGRNGFYRYYVCRTRQAKGARACSGRRVPADDLESAIGSSLLDAFSRFEIFEQGVREVYAEIGNERPRLEAEHASTETQLRETVTTLDRYLRAFEAGTMPADLCAPRVAELSARRDELTAHRDELAARLRATVPELPSRELIAEIRVEIERVVSHASPDVVKQLFAELIDRVEISPDNHAYPYFRVPDAKKPGPIGTRASCRTPVRMGSHQVEVAGIEPASSGDSVGLLRAKPTGDCRGRHRCRRPCRPVSGSMFPMARRNGRSGKPHLMTPVCQPVGLRLDGRRYFLGSERELRLGVCFWFRLFYVAPETTARFSHIDYRSRDHSPPCLGLSSHLVGRPLDLTVLILPCPSRCQSGRANRCRSCRQVNPSSPTARPTGQPAPPPVRPPATGSPGACREACVRGPRRAGPWPCRRGSTATAGPG
jgi:site-specific DNA recombinase